MKLLNSNVSPFAARPRLAIYAGQLPVEIVPANMWTADFQKSPDYLAVNPIGKIPTLLLDDGTGLPESAVITEYLVDAFPESGLRPADPVQAARDRLLAHLIEIYVQSPAGPLFGQLFAKERDNDVIDRSIAVMDNGMGHVAHYISSDRYAVGTSISLADFALVPFLFFFADRMPVTFGRPSLIGNHRAIARYWDRVQPDKHVTRILGEMRDAIKDSRLAMLLETPE
jgi:glutathione S-transferase